MNAGESGFKMFALVRDSRGMPKFDNIFDIPDEIWDMLTENEQQEINELRGKINGSNASYSYP